MRARVLISATRVLISGTHALRILRMSQLACSFLRILFECISSRAHFLGLIIIIIIIIIISLTIIIIIVIIIIIIRLIIIVPQTLGNKVPLCPSSLL